MHDGRLQLKDVMTAGVETISVDATAQEAALKMATLDIGFLLVVKEDVTVGALTDRDIAVRAVAPGLNPMEVRVGEIMSARHSSQNPVITSGTSVVDSLPTDYDLGDAVALMRQKSLRRMLVHDEAYHIVGVVSLADLAAASGRTSAA